MKAILTIDEHENFDINIKYSQEFFDHMTIDTNTFGWEILVRTVEGQPNIF